jgi:hypothetical protein
MYVRGDGNVGIGTSSPLSKLHTVGSSTAIDNSGIMQISTGTAFATNKLIFGINDGSYAWIQAIQPDVAYRNLVLQGGGGNVLIGTTTDNGYKLRVQGGIFSSSTIVSGSGFKNDSGSVSGPSGTFVTLFTVSGSKGAYHVYSQVPGGAGDAANYTAYAIVLWDGSAARIILNNGGILFNQLSGLNVQASQSSGNTANIDWIYLKIQG